MPDHILDTNGQPLNHNPVVAHVLTVPGHYDDENIDQLKAMLDQWQTMTGVRVLALTGGCKLVASLHADGTLGILPVDPELTSRLVQIIDTEP